MTVEDPQLRDARKRVAPRLKIPRRTDGFMESVGWSVVKGGA
jgi:hypothetical protein